ncbi:MAG: alpha/beta hydrolase [Actinomycetota bacterium]
MSDQPALPLVLVHGAWHGAWYWATLQAELDRLGVPSFAPDLPGHGVSDQPLGDLHGDAEFIAAAIERLGTDVVLVAHSYGGAVIGEAALRTGHVKHLVYISAFVLDEGESVVKITILDGVPEEPPTLIGAARSRSDHGTLVLDPRKAIPAIYGDAPPAVAQAFVARLTEQPIATFVQPASGAAWKTTPSTFVRCLRDRAIAINHQDLMAARCTEVVTFDSDHSPGLTMPVETAALLAEITRRPRP